MKSFIPSMNRFVTRLPRKPVGYCVPDTNMEEAIITFASHVAPVAGGVPKL